MEDTESRGGLFSMMSSQFDQETSEQCVCRRLDEAAKRCVRGYNGYRRFVDILTGENLSLIQLAIITSFIGHPVEREGMW